jgi:glycosyltransferase involved in cell wall biosynthesis
MANGKATLASDIPAIQEIITDGYNGILARPDRPSDLARNIRRLVDSREYTNLLGENAKKTIREKYLWKNIELNLTNFYHSNLVLEKN